MSLGRTQPHSLEAEEHLLSTCLIDALDMLPRCILAKIRRDSFYDTKHGIVYQCMVDMFNDKKPVDVATVAEELKTRKELDQVGGYPFLTQVSSRVATTAQASFFIEKVVEQATLRTIIRSNTGIVEDCYNYSGDLPDFLASIERKFVRGLSEYTDDTQTKKLSEVCDTIIQEVADMRAGKLRGDENDLSWGIPDVDKYLKKFRRGELVVLAARPGIGKSSLMRQIIVRNVIRDGKNVCVFSLEVTTDELIRNMAQALSGVNPREITKYPNDDQDAFVKWVQKISAFSDKLHVQDINASLAHILANIRIIHARTPVDMVCIDYLQLINEKQDKGENRDQLLGRVTRALKLLANELKCVVILLSQLNRSSEKDNRPPVLADLRESGNIEQDADRVTFIYRPATRPDGSTQDLNDETLRFFYQELLQRKGRNVGEHSLGMNFERLAARFLPIVKDHTHAPSSSQLL